MIKNNGNQKLVEFGNGDIRISCGRINGEAVLGLNQNIKNEEIGKLSETQETIYTIQNAEIYFTFKNLKSLETLILKLQEARSLIVYPDYEFEQPKNLTELYEPNSIIKG